MCVTGYCSLSCVYLSCVFSWTDRSSFLWDMTLSRAAVWILIAQCGKALSALTHGWHHRSPQCFAAGGTNRGDSQCKRGRIKTQGSATDSACYHVCLTQNHWRQWGRFPSTGYTVVISYVNILDYTFDTLTTREAWLLVRDVTCLRPVPFFPLRKPFDTFSEARLQIPSPIEEFSSEGGHKFTTLFTVKCT